MGTMNWISAGGITKHDLLARLYFAETKKTTLDAMIKGDVGAMDLPSGRVLLFCDRRSFSPGMAAAASTGGDAIYGYMTEIVTASIAIAFVDGTEMWSVESAVDRDPEVVTTGTPPPSLNKYMRTAAEEDYNFDVPLKLSLEFGSYQPNLNLFDRDSEVYLIEPIDDFDRLHRREAKRLAQEAARAARAEKGGLLTRLFGPK